MATVPSMPRSDEAEMMLWLSARMLSAVSRILPPDPAEALAIIRLSTKIMKIGSMSILPPLPTLLATVVVISLLLSATKSPTTMVMLPPLPAAASAVILPPMSRNFSDAWITMSPAKPVPVLDEPICP